MKRRKVADRHVGALLDLGDRALIDLERLAEFFLRQLHRAAHLGKVHLSVEPHGRGFRCRTRFRRHAGAKFCEGTPTGHG